MNFSLNVKQSNNVIYQSIMQVWKRKFPKSGLFYQSSYRSYSSILNEHIKTYSRRYFKHEPSCECLIVAEWIIIIECKYNTVLCPRLVPDYKDIKLANTKRLIRGTQYIN